MTRRFGLVNCLAAGVLALIMLAASPARADICQAWQQQIGGVCQPLCPDGQQWKQKKIKKGSGQQPWTCVANACGPGSHVDALSNKCVPTKTGSGFPCGQNQHYIQTGNFAVCGVCTGNTYLQEASKKDTYEGPPGPIYSCEPCGSSKTASDNHKYCYGEMPKCDLGTWAHLGSYPGVVFPKWSCLACQENWFGAIGTSEKKGAFTPKGVTGCFPCPEGSTSKKGSTTCKCAVGSFTPITGTATKNPSGTCAPVANSNPDPKPPGIPKPAGQSGQSGACAPGVSPSASRTGCAPKLDSGLGTPGSSFRSPGSTPAPPPPPVSRGR
jgi:hypothetical protein